MKQAMHQACLLVGSNIQPAKNIPLAGEYLKSAALRLAEERHLYSSLSIPSVICSEREVSNLENKNKLERCRAYGLNVFH